MQYNARVSRLSGVGTLGAWLDAKTAQGRPSWGHTWVRCPSQIEIVNHLQETVEIRPGRELE